MKKPVFKGSGVALVTPFTEIGVNFHVLEKMLAFHLKNHTDAIIVCGTTGEASTMTYRERMQTISFCAEYVNGRVPVIAGTGSNSTAVAIALTKDACKCGADAVLVVTPYYNKATQTGLIRHYQTIADVSDRPLILYNVPSRTGVSISPETCAVLSAHPNINGIKEASGNLGAVQEIRLQCGEEFFIWSGNDDEIVPICALGGCGVISVAANLVPQQIHDMVSLCLENHFTEAGILQLQLKKLCDMLFCEVNPIPARAALDLIGWETGSPRLPLCEPSPMHLDLIRNTLLQYGLIPQSV